MRPLTDDETKVLFEKLANYIGKNIEQLINRPDEKCCFRLHKDRVYYVRCEPESPGKGTRLVFGLRCAALPLPSENRCWPHMRNHRTRSATNVQLQTCLALLVASWRGTDRNGIPLVMLPSNETRPPLFCDGFRVDLKSVTHQIFIVHISTSRPTSNLCLVSS